VAVDRKRVNGVRQLMERIPDLEVILLDDAYQHRYISPGLNILLIDYNRPISEDRLLPAGRLREQGYERRRANIILITKCPDRLKPIELRLIVKDLKLYPLQHLFFTKLTYENPVPVFSGIDNPLSLQEMKEVKPRILMLTGIAGPRLFKKYLRGISTRITELSYPDHHQFREKDLQTIQQTWEEMEGEKKFIFTTEKDAMRLRKFYNLAVPLKNSFYYVPIGISVLNEDGEELNQHILNYVRNNKRNSILHKKPDGDQS
jgi:tetraacyldisaccharide 4'-kinase